MEQNYTGAGNPSRRFRPDEDDGVVEMKCCKKLQFPLLRIKIKIY